MQRRGHRLVAGRDADELSAQAVAHVEERKLRCGLARLHQHLGDIVSPNR
jgi:hypothetical protein